MNGVWQLSLCLRKIWPTFVLHSPLLCPSKQTIKAKNIIRRKFSWFQIEKIRQKSHRLSVSELAISGFWGLEITNFCSLDIRAKCLICVFGRDVCLICYLRLSCNCKFCETFKQTIEAKNITIENLMFLMSDASNDEIFISYSKKKISEVRLSE